MLKLEEIYEITTVEYYMCNIFFKIFKHNKLKKILLKCITKISKRNYTMKNNLLRYCLHKYLGLPIGKYTYGIEHFLNRLDQLEGIESIGAFCSLSQDIHLAKSNHPTHCITTSPILYLRDFGICQEDDKTLDYCEKIVIGNDVYIGCNTTIMPGVKIGNGSIIGAGALVVKDVPSYAIVGGVPAKIIRYRYNNEEIELLESIKWWDWTDNKIRECIHLFKNNKAFLNNFR